MTHSPNLPLPLFPLSSLIFRYPGANVPKYLADSGLPVVTGFDPLRLGTNPDMLKVGEH